MPSTIAHQNSHVIAQDVAKLAGVSRATVSHAINLTGRMRPETRRRVLLIARQLRYYPNQNAQSLAGRTSRTMGIIVSDIRNPFFAEAIRSFEARARHWSYDVIVKETEYKVSWMRRAAERMLEQKVRGVAILTSEMSRSWLNEIVRRDIPVCCFDLDFASERAINMKVDYLSGMRQVIDHLHQLGHRRIAYVGGRRVLKNILSRHDGFVASMREHGLEPGPMIIGDQSLEGGLSAGLSLLKVFPRPTAAVSINDLTAVGLIKAFSDHGLRVPQDVSVTGFDNTYLAEYFLPRLTTVDMHPDILGRTALDALHEASAETQTSGREFRIDLDLVVGNSTGPAPGAMDSN
jgi:LacI family transcriptional regulator